MFTLANSCLTTSNLHWFMDLTFQVLMQYYYLQHWTLFPSPVTSTIGHCFYSFTPLECMTLQNNREILRTLKEREVLFYLTTYFLYIKYGWYTILCYCQVYNVVIQHLHALWNGHQYKLNNHLLPYKIIIMLFIIFLMLYSTSYWLIFSITRSFYFLIPFTFFTQPLTSLPSGNY